MVGLAEPDYGSCPRHPLLGRTLHPVESRLLRHPTHPTHLAAVTRNTASRPTSALLRARRNLSEQRWTTETRPAGPIAEEAHRPALPRSHGPEQPPRLDHPPGRVRAWQEVLAQQGERLGIGRSAPQGHLCGPPCPSRSEVIRRGHVGAIFEGTPTAVDGHERHSSGGRHHAGPLCRALDAVNACAFLFPCRLGPPSPAGATVAES